MAAHWQSATGEIAELMNEIPKIVCSRTLNQANWNNSTLIKENVSGEIANMKADGDKDMHIFGSANLSKKFIQDDLFDELRIGIAPVITGKDRSEEQPSELQSKMRITYAVICLNKKN